MTAWKRLEQEITETTDNKVESLKNEFYALYEIPVNKDPKQAIRKLEDIRSELRSDHGVVKTDEDICDIVFKALPEEYSIIVDSLRTKQSEDGSLSLTMVQRELGAKHQSIAAGRRKRIKKKRKQVRRFQVGNLVKRMVVLVVVDVQLVQEH